MAQAESRPSMNISCFESFIEIAKRGSFSEAAKALNFSQPALSFHVQALEKIYGETLFDRSGNKVRLTEGGKIFLPYAKEIVRANKRLVESLDELKGKIRGRLALGASTIPGEYLLPGLLGKFIARYPEVEPSLEIADTGIIINKIKAHEIDLGFVGAHPPEESLKTIDYAKDDLVLICSSDHRLSKKKAITIGQVLKEPFILREDGSGTRTTFEKALRKKALSPKDLNVIMELGSTQAIMTAVEAGLGVSVVSRWAIEKEIALNRLVFLEIDDLDLSRKLFLIFIKERPLTRVQKEFIDFLSGAPAPT